MNDPGHLIQYITGPMQLVGLVVLVLAGLVPRFSPRGSDRKSQRTLVIGLLVVGTIAVVGGIGIEAMRTRGAGGRVTGNVVNGDGNAVGIDNAVGSKAAPVAGGRAGEVTGNVVNGNHNALGIASSAQPLPETSK